MGATSEKFSFEPAEAVTDCTEEVYNFRTKTSSVHSESQFSRCWSRPLRSAPIGSHSVFESWPAWTILSHNSPEIHCSTLCTMEAIYCNAFQWHYGDAERVGALSFKALSTQSLGAMNFNLIRWWNIPFFWLESSATYNKNTNNVRFCSDLQKKDSYAVSQWHICGYLIHPYADSGGVFVMFM